MDIPLVEAGRVGTDDPVRCSRDRIVRLRCLYLAPANRHSDALLWRSISRLFPPMHRDCRLRMPGVSSARSDHPGPTGVSRSLWCDDHMGDRRISDRPKLRDPSANRRGRYFGRYVDRGFRRGYTAFLQIPNCLRYPFHAAGLRPVITMFQASRRASGIRVRKSSSFFSGCHHQRRRGVSS